VVLDMLLLLFSLLWKGFFLAASCCSMVLFRVPQFFSYWLIRKGFTLWCDQYMELVFIVSVGLLLCAVPSAFDRDHGASAV
jgi:hypothetical protein